MVCQCLLLGQFIETPTTKSLPLVSVLKGLTSLLLVQKDVHMNQRDVHLFCKFRMTFT